MLDSNQDVREIMVEEVGGESECIPHCIVSNWTWFGLDFIWIRLKCVKSAGTWCNCLNLFC